MSVRPENMRDRRIAKAARLLKGEDEFTREVLNETTPSGIRAAIKARRCWLKLVDEALFQAEFYAAEIAGEEIPKE